MGLMPQWEGTPHGAQKRREQLLKVVPACSQVPPVHRAGVHTGLQVPDPRSLLPVSTSGRSEAGAHPVGPRHSLGGGLSSRSLQSHPALDPGDFTLKVVTASVLRLSSNPKR